MSFKQSNSFKRKSFNVEQYTKHVQNSPCFICEIVSKNPENHHHIIYEDE